ncbi:amino acid racemase [Orrella sp. JC864]|uniref:amino acid racemase n=1 Tax=Orrella sp. JC864 TaxID=3120298 RepID=UPI00300AB664
MPECSKNAPARRRYGVVGGPGAVAGADVLVKMIRAAGAGADAGVPAPDIAFEQRGLQERPGIAQDGYDPTLRKFHVYDALKDMQARGVDVALVPCFVSHTFLHEIAPQLGLRLVSLFDALRAWIAREHAGIGTIGVLASPYVRQSGLFERELGGLARIVHPGQAAQRQLMDAVYGPQGLRAGRQDGDCVALLAQACADLAGQGAQIIVPGMTELPVLAEALRPLAPVPLLDVNAIYAQFALGVDGAPPPCEFKLGVLGGVGPAATVDFMRKVVDLTQAGRDQDHIKMVVEQNPQIPDRTANLVGGGDDPTIPLLATCQRLQAGGAHAIAIPCNTAHAYVDRIQPYLQIPIVNMLSEVAAHLRERLPAASRVGLLATSGTVASGVYRAVIEAAGMRLLVPDAAHQARVMQAIYGPRGVKAGYTSGACSEHLAAAIAHLAGQGAQALILGCTELPLIALAPGQGGQAELVDPTAILAARCVDLARRRAQ